MVALPREPSPTCRSAKRRAAGLRSAIIALLLHGAPSSANEGEPQGAGPTSDSMPVEEMVVVAEPRPPMDVLAGASTTRIDVNAGLIEGARIEDLLATVPGVQIRRLGGAGGAVEISIRGSSPQQVPIFLDGIRIESGLTSRSDLSAICLDVVEEIQVTRGAGAARVGSGGIGGLVNLVSSPAKEKPETRVRIGGGNYGTVEGSVRHSRKFANWDVSLAYCGLHTDGDFKYQRARNSTGGGSSPIERRKNNDADRHTTLTQVGRSFENLRVEFTQLFGHLDRGSPGAERNTTRLADERDTSVLTVGRLNNRPDEDAVFDWTATLAHRIEFNRFRDPVPYLGRFSAINSRSTFQSVTPRLRFAGAVDRFGASHDFSLLAEGRFDQRGSNEAKTKSRAGGAIRAEGTSHWLKDRLRFSPSLRLERFEGLDLEWIPALFLEADVAEGVRFSVSGSRSYRAPSFEELYLPDKGFERGNEDLAPEEAWNFEAGLRIESPFEAAWLDGHVEFVYFLSKLDESIAFEQISTNIFAYVNVGESRTRGHELTVSWRPHDWARLSASRTVTATRRDSNNRNVAGIAVSQIDGRLELGPRDRLRVVGEVHYIGRLPLNSGGTAWLPSRVSFDASVATDLSRWPDWLKLSQSSALPSLPDSLWLTLRARNLSNAAIRDTRAFPRPGRNFSFALEGKF